MSRKIFFIMLLVLISIVPVLLAEESDFKFTNWPLEEFDDKSVLTNYSDKHFGIDIKSVEGTEVKAVSDGKIYWTYSGGSHGISVGIEHENGLRTTYLHLSERIVKKGQLVKASEVIGKVGTTGTGRDAILPHLHFALIKDAKLDINNPNRYGNPLEYGPLPPIKNEINPEKKVEPSIEPAIEPIIEPINSQISTQVVNNYNPLYVQTSLLAAAIQAPVRKIKTIEILEGKVSQTIAKRQVEIHPKSIGHKSMRESIKSVRLLALNSPVLQVANLLKTIKFRAYLKKKISRGKSYVLNEKKIEKIDLSKIAVSCLILLLALIGLTNFSKFNVGMLVRGFMRDKLLPNT